MSKQVYTAKDISEILGVSESKSYQYIRQMNSELRGKRISYSAWPCSGGVFSRKVFRYKNGR